MHDLQSHINILESAPDSAGTSWQVGLARISLVKTTTLGVYTLTADILHETDESMAKDGIQRAIAGLAGIYGFAPNYPCILPAQQPVDPDALPGEKVRALLDHLRAIRALEDDSPDPDAVWENTHALNLQRLIDWLDGDSTYPEAILFKREE